MKYLRLLAVLALLLPSAALAQTTAAQVQPGFLSTVGCPSAALTPCWLPYSNANPLPVTGGGGGGGSVTQGTVPWADNITQWGSAALGAPSAYGTSPGAVTVPGVNAFVTNALSLAVAPLTSTNLSGSITTTNTFQSIQVSTSGRKGCAIQNNGTHLMYVYFGALGSATEATAYNLAAGGSVTCAVGGLGVLTDQVSITGTAADLFFANMQ